MTLTRKRRPSRRQMGRPRGPRDPRSLIRTAPNRGGSQQKRAPEPATGPKIPPSAVSVSIDRRTAPNGHTRRDHKNDPFWRFDLMSDNIAPASGPLGRLVGAGRRDGGRAGEVAPRKQSRRLRSCEPASDWHRLPAVCTGRNGIVPDRLRDPQAVGCRAALIFGEKSALVSRETASYMSSLMGPRAPVVEVPEARHHVMLDQPLGFVAALRMLLDSWMRNESAEGSS